ncbi:MAG: hypothetical protein ACK578_04940 [Pirellula sp.]
MRSNTHRYHVARQRGTIAVTSLAEARGFITALIANVGWWSGWGTQPDHRPTLTSSVVASAREFSSVWLRLWLHAGEQRGSLSFASSVVACG